MAFYRVPSQLAELSPKTCVNLSKNDEFTWILQQILTQRICSMEVLAKVSPLPGKTSVFFARNLIYLRIDPNLPGKLLQRVLTALEV